MQSSRKTWLTTAAEKKKKKKKKKGGNVYAQTRLSEHSLDLGISRQFPRNFLQGPIYEVQTLKMSQNITAKLHK